MTYQSRSAFTPLWGGLAALSLAIAVTVTAQAQSGPATPGSEPGANPFEASPGEDEDGAIDPAIEAVIARMGEVIAAIDSSAQRDGNSWEFTLNERSLLVVFDPAALRMRVVTPIVPVDVMPEGAMARLMQANFDTALDARYAVANGLVWRAFIHPLDSLTMRDFASGIMQAKSLADTFGTTFSSGSVNYGGGDSGRLIEENLRELLDEIERRESV